MTHKTERQHYVPRFYLNHWLNPDSKRLYLYDFQTAIAIETQPSVILLEKDYYEDSRTFPANFVESILSALETKTALILDQMSSIVTKYPRFSQANLLKSDLRALLAADNGLVIREFAAYQYLRIPGAIEQKEREMTGTGMDKEILLHHLKPANFVTTGFDFITERFLTKMGMIISVSQEYDLLTSDWPCFDMRLSENAPLLGVEIGSRSEVFLTFPLLPRVLLSLYPRSYIPKGHIVTTLPVDCISEGEARNTNTLIIQQARRWVISRNKHDFIFRVANKRLKMPIPSAQPTE